MSAGTAKGSRRDRVAHLDADRARPRGEAALAGGQRRVDELGEEVVGGQEPVAFPPGAGPPGPGGDDLSFRPAVIELRPGLQSSDSISPPRPLGQRRLATYPAATAQDTTPGW